MMKPEERAELYKFVARNAATDVSAAKVLRCLHIIDEMQLEISALKARMSTTADEDDVAAMEKALENEAIHIYTVWTDEYPEECRDGYVRVGNMGFRVTRNDDGSLKAERA